MTKRVFSQAAPLLIALTPLLYWGHDLRFSRWALLCLAIGVAWATRPLERQPFQWVAFASLGALLAGLSWAVHGFPLLGITTTLEWIAGTLLVITLIHDRRPADYARWWVLSVTASALYGIGQAVGLFRAPRDAYGQIDAAATFGLSNFAAETLVLTIPVTVALFLRSRETWARTVLPGLAGIQVLYLLLTGSRAGWLGLTAAGLVVLLAWRPSDRRAYYGAAGAMAIFVVAFLAMGGSSLNPFSGSDPSLTFRLEAWKATLAMARDHLVLGVGPGLFASWVSEYSSVALDTVSRQASRSVHHPHNEYLAALSQMGVAALLWMLAGAAALMIGLLRRRSFWEAAGLAGAFVIAGLSFPLQHAPFWAIFAILLGFGFSRHALKTHAGDVALGVGPFTRGTILLLALAAVGFFGTRAVANDASRRGVAALEHARVLAVRAPDRAETEKAQAAGHLRRALRIWSADPESIYNLAMIVPSPRERIRHLENYTAMMHGDLRGQTALAAAHYEAGDPDRAIADLQRVLDAARHPIVNVVHRLISMQVAEKRYTDALATTRQALAKFPDDTQLLLNMADILRLTGADADAAVFYRRVLLTQPKRAEIYLRAGLAFETVGNYAEAESALQEGRARDARDPAFYVYLARLAQRDGRTGEARALLFEAMRYDPNLASNLRDTAPELILLLKADH